MQLLLHKQRLLVARPLLLLHRRALSSSSSPPPPPVAVQFPTLGQGSTFSVRLHRVPAQVTITSAWIDHTELLIVAPPHAPALDVQVLNEGDGGNGKETGRGSVLSISDAKMLLPPDTLKYLDGHYHIHATIPEKVHTLQVHLSQSPGTITLPKKIEGESIDLLSKEGDVLLNKIRGVKIDVSAERGTVDVGKWVEGDLTVRAGRLTAKMIKGHRVRLQVRGGKEGGREGEPPLVVEALYGRQASVLCTALSPPSPPPSFSLTEDENRGGGDKGRSEGGGPPIVAVDIGRSHGALKVVATGGGVRLGGVNGSAVVQTGGGGGSEGGSGGGIDVRFEALEPGCVSVLATQGGPINLLVAPEVQASFRVEGNAAATSFLAAVEKEGGREGGRGGVQGLEIGKSSEGVVEGRLTGKAPEPSRKKQHQQQLQQQQHGSHGRVGVGKIDLKGAQDQALKAFFNEGGKEGGKEVASILVRTQGEGGTLRVKTLSWMDAIKRDFGLEHIDYSPEGNNGGGNK